MARYKKKFKRWLIGHVVSLCMLAMSKLSLAISHRLAAYLAGRAVKRKSSSYKTTLRNIQLCLPDLDKNQQVKLVHDSMFSSMQLACEMPHLLYADLRKCLSYIDSVTGVEYLQEALKAGKGVMVLSPHIGNWEFIVWYLSSKYPFTAMYKPHLYPAMDKVLRYGRTKAGANLVPTNIQGIRAIHKALTSGEIVLILPDQNPGAGQSVEVSFFNVLTPTSTLTAKLVAKTGATVLTASATRLDNSRGFKLAFTPAQPAITGSLEQATAAMNQNIEECVRLHPAQYQWEYDRFKHLTL